MTRHLPDRVSYVGEAECRSVFLHTDGTYRFSPGEMPLTRCKYCNTFTSYCATKLCNNCWEVSTRVGDMLRSERGRAVLEKIMAEEGPKEERR